VIADLSRNIGESKARLNLMSHWEIEQTWDRMQAITTRFLAAVNYHGNPALPLLPQYPQLSSSSTSTCRSYQAPSSLSRPAYPTTLYASSFVARPLVHPPWRLSPLGGPSPRGSTPAPAPGGPTAVARATPLVPQAHVPSSSTSVVLPSGNDHNSISNNIQILDSINYNT
jgi:hypothetical protein